VLAQAKEKGIPVIAYDRLIMNSDAVSYYATFDNWLVGTTQGEFIENALGLKDGKGPFNIEFITGDPGDNNINFFFDGAMSVLQKYLDNGQLVCPSGQTEKAVVATANWATDAAQARFENILSSNYADGTQLDAVLASNDSTALGLENALASSYTGTYPVITGQDCDIAIMKNLIEGKQAMSVFKDTRTLAAKVVEMVDALMKGSEPPVNDTKTYDNGTGIIPSFLCQPVACTVENTPEVLINSGYYTYEQLGIEETTLTLWCIATESDANRPAYEKAIADYQAKHLGVTIKMESFENESYKTKIKAAMMGGDDADLPDIFFTWSGAFLGDFVDAGKVACLDDVYKNYTDKIPEVMLANTTYGGKHYGVPTTFNIVAMFANMDMLAEVGWDHVPQTYDDLIKCCDALVAAGKIPFGCAGKETWCVTEYLEPIMLKYIGYEDLNAIFAGEKSWNDPDIATAVSTFQDMINKGYFDPSGAALGNDETKANFLAGKTAFYQNGSWNTGEINDASFKSAVALFPLMNAKRSSYEQTIGGPSDSLAVVASSKNVELASEVAVELGKEICHYNYLNAVGLPAWIPDYDTSSLKPLLVDIADIVANCEGMVLFGDTAMPADRANVYLDYVAQVYGCAVDGKDFVAGLTADLG
jgi:raffinose/stachyose/melibiose transport system substrate-binding protein